jgi:hypothetical protein
VSPPQEVWRLRPGQRPIIPVCIHEGGRSRPCTALLDLGANVTLISLTLAGALNLTPMPASGSSRRGKKGGPSPVYQADIELPGALGVLRQWTILGRDDLPDPDDGFDVILGMDLWITCSLFVDGPGRRFGMMR